MYDTMAWNPKKRPTASQVLRYPFFQVGQHIQRAKMNRQQTLARMDSQQLNAAQNSYAQQMHTQQSYAQQSYTQQMNDKKLSKRGSLMDSTSSFGALKQQQGNDIQVKGTASGLHIHKKKSSAVKDSVDEFDSVLDDLDSSMNKSKFPALAKRVRDSFIFLLISCSSNAVSIER